jgi:hypothetical protein
MSVAVRAIEQADLPAVGRFLHSELNARVPADSWVAALETPWQTERPNYGFLLDSGSEIVGVYLAFYSTRTVDSEQRRFCNLGAWCVREDSRFHSVRLLKAMLGQTGYTFTDLSPSGAVVALNEKLRFTHLDTATALMPALPYPSRPGRIRMTANPQRIASQLTGEQLRIFEDHRNTAAARHLLIRVGDRSCYLIFRKDRRKNLPIFASILYVSDPEVFAIAATALARRLLFRHGVLAMLVELRVAHRRPRPSIMLRSPRPKMFKSADLSADEIDYLYSELVCLAW